MNLYRTFLHFQRRSRSSKTKSESSNFKSIIGPTGNKKKLEDLDRFLEALPFSHFIWRKCQGLGIDRKTYKAATVKFVQAINNNMLDITKDKFISDEPLKGYDRKLLPHLFRFIQSTYKLKENTFEDLMLLSDLRSPAEWYPTTRNLKRKIIMHVGPTNSGKTYNALKRFKEANSAIYCGPLRLLAHEIYEKCNQEGIACNLLTGEEKRESDGVQKWSCTVEMASTSKEFDVAVVDEIQMIGDSFRGMSWTRAFLGLQAKEIHLCGEATAVNLIKRLCEETEDDLEINHYNRLCPLEIDSQSLNGKFDNIQAGDCVVTFSRKNIYAIKREIEKRHKFRTAIIYGSLPPEARAEQARVFNDPNSPFKVLVASDAIGMGLNLNIRRIVFESLKKYDGEVHKYLSVSQAKQIAGRAGRYKSQWEDGLVTTLERKDHGVLQKYMKVEAEELPSAGLAPEFEQLEKFAGVLPNASLPVLFQKFDEIATVDNNFFLTNLRDQIMLATELTRVNLSLRDHYTFSLSPTSTTDKFCIPALVCFAKFHSSNKVCFATNIPRVERGVVNIDSLKLLESQHRILTLYLWLSVRYPETFVDADKVRLEKKKIEDGINELLISVKYLSKRVANMLKKEYEFADLFDAPPTLVEHYSSTTKSKKNIVNDGY
jgi:ATP-dependent RNA helicase SUPV3L1/SUV3